MDKTKSFSISKQVVWDAYLRVKSNKGSAGIDQESIEQFEEDLKNNLYKLWNRMSSGCYFPEAVREVRIPKKDGRQRSLGIPTVTDRIAQMVAKIYLEPVLDPVFNKDSYGYRPNKSALEAVGTARKRCWQSDWVIDLDIKRFFDTIDHDLMMKAVKAHTQEKWIILYITRWLQAPMMDETGILQGRKTGTPQGGVISPLLANLYLHYALDAWLVRTQPEVCFERYADDMIIHCTTRKQAEELLERIRMRLKDCSLELNESKTKVIYCKDDRRDDEYNDSSFDFLGFTFKARKVRSKKGVIYFGFNPAISEESAAAIKYRIRKWRLHKWCSKSVEEVADEINAVLRGWIYYFGAFYRSALYPIWDILNRRLKKWARCKYKKLRGAIKRSGIWMERVYTQNPNLFAHWPYAAISRIG